MAQHRVRITGTEMVKPAQCLGNPPKLKLTGFDMIMEKVPYQQRILFYQSPEAATFQEILQLLKKSLAEVLVVFYPFAGRISSDEHGDSVIDCGAGQSVQFIEAVTDSSLEQLGEFRPCEFCDSLCDMGGTLPKFPWKLEDPLLFIQVTRFSCGGISLGFAFNHHVADGTSAWHFMTSWANVAKTGSVMNPPEITYSIKMPHLTAEQLAQKAKEIQFMVEASPAETSPNSLNDSVNSTFQLVTKLYNLDPVMIQKLKADAAAQTSGTRFSTFVVLSAYFWRKVTLARQLPQSRVTGFVTVVNCRERVSALSKWYFGNAASGLGTTLETGEIERDVRLSRCTATLHQGIAECTGESLLASVAFFVQAMRNPEKTSEPEAKSLYDQKVVQPIGSPRHPVYESDFGFGRPAGVTFGTGDLGDGKLYMFPSAKGDGGVTATIVLPSDVMERLAQQED